MAGVKPKTKQPLRPRHVPERTCVACRQHDAKRGLIRLVRTAEGSVEVDLTGKRNGRGAYLCRVRECWETGLTRKSVENNLKISMDAATRQSLREFGATLPARQDTTVNSEGTGGGE